MLLIKVRDGQSIVVGNQKVKVLRIHKGSHQNFIEYEIENNDGMCYPSTSLVAGDSINVGQLTVMTLTKVLSGQKPTAVLGFEAPMSIKIYGTWLGEKS